MLPTQKRKDISTTNPLFLMKISNAIEEMIRLDATSKFNKVMTFDMKPSKSNTLDHLKKLEKLIPSEVKEKESMFILTLISLDQYSQKKKDFYLNTNNFENFLSVCLLTNIKLYSDYCYSNKIFATTLGIDLEYLNKMEAFFLFDMNFDLIISEKIYQQYRDQLLPEPENVTPPPAKKATLSINP